MNSGPENKKAIIEDINKALGRRVGLMDNALSQINDDDLGYYLKTRFDCAKTQSSRTLLDLLRKYNPTEKNTNFTRVYKYISEHKDIFLNTDLIAMPFQPSVIDKMLQSSIFGEAVITAQDMDILSLESIKQIIAGSEKSVKALPSFLDEVEKQGKYSVLKQVVDDQGITLMNHMCKLYFRGRLTKKAKKFIINCLEKDKIDKSYFVNNQDFNDKISPLMWLATAVRYTAINKKAKKNDKAITGKFNVTGYVPYLELFGPIIEHFKKQWTAEDFTQSSKIQLTGRRRPECSGNITKGLSIQCMFQDMPINFPPEEAAITNFKKFMLSLVEADLKRKRKPEEFTIQSKRPKYSENRVSENCYTASIFESTETDIDDSDQTLDDEFFPVVFDETSSLLTDFNNKKHIGITDRFGILEPSTQEKNSTNSLVTSPFV